MNRRGLDLSKLSIRPADPVRDTSALMVLFLRELQEIGPLAGEVNQLKVLGLITTYFHTGLVLLAEYEGKIIGASAALPESPPWSLDIYSSVKWFYVIKKYRTFGVLRKLMGEMVGTLPKPLLFSTTTAHNPEGQKKFYERLGLRFAGTQFILRE